jgi:hypothetical protein
MTALALDSVSRRSNRQRVVRPLVFAFLLGCVSTVACTSSVPRQYLPYPLTNDTFDDSVKVVNIPLPVIKTDPNEGVSLGALSAFLLHNKNDEIGTMIVPQVNYNQNFGLTLRLFGAFYPEPGRRWEFTLSKSTHVNEDYTLKFRDSTWLDGKLELTGEVTAFTDGAARFFGFQSQSSSRNETNYADEEKGFNVSAAYRILPHIQLMIGERFRRVDIGHGAVTSLPGIQDVFSPAEVPGIDGFTAHAQRVGATFSTLDDPNLPTRGLYGTGIFEITTKALGSTADYRHYMLELKGFFL